MPFCRLEFPDRLCGSRHIALFKYVRFSESPAQRPVVVTRLPGPSRHGDPVYQLRGIQDVMTHPALHFLAVLVFRCFLALTGLAQLVCDWHIRVIYGRCST